MRVVPPFCSPGIRTSFPQPGHIPSLPADASEKRSSSPQEQATSRANFLLQAFEKPEDRLFDLDELNVEQAPRLP